MKDRILKLLKENARLTNEQIARYLGTSVEEVAKAIRELEESRTLLGYKAIVNTELLPEETVEAVIEVSVRPRRDQGFDNIARRIYRFPEVTSLYLMSGGSDFLVFIEGQSLKDIAQFITQKLASLEDVRSTATHFVLKRYKKDGVKITAEETDHRLPVIA